MTRMTLAAAVLAALISPVRASASPIEIHFSGTVTLSDYNDVYVVAPEIGERIGGTIFFDTDDVWGSNPYGIDASTPMSLDLGGMVSGLSHTVRVIDGTPVHPGDPNQSCAPLCDGWRLSFRTTTPWQSDLWLYDEITFVDETAGMLTGEDFLVPGGVDGWTSVVLEARHADYGGLYLNLQATIDSWTVVPEPGVAILLGAGLALLAGVRTRRA